MFFHSSFAFRHSSFRAAALLLALATLTGCPREARIGGRAAPDVIIDELREENVALRREVEQLNDNIDRRLQQIEAMEQALERDGKTLPDADGVGPRFTSVRLDRYSGFLDTDGDGTDDTLRLYVRTLDQDGRFIPTSARATVQAVAIRPEQPPLVIVQQTFEPETFTRAYRSGFLGTHYTLELPLPDDFPANLPPDVDSATVQVSLTDTVTGTTAQREATMRIAR